MELTTGPWSRRCWVTTIAAAVATSRKDTARTEIRAADRLRSLTVRRPSGFGSDSRAGGRAYPSGARTGRLVVPQNDRNRVALRILANRVAHPLRLRNADDVPDHRRALRIGARIEHDDAGGERRRGVADRTDLVLLLLQLARRLGREAGGRRPVQHGDPVLARRAGAAALLAPAGGPRGPRAPRVLSVPPSDPREAGRGAPHVP